MDHEAVVLERTRWVPPADRPGAPSPCARPRPTPRAWANTWPSADDVALAAPWSGNRREMAERGSVDRASPHPSWSRAASRAAPVCWAVASLQAPLEQAAVLAVHQRSSPRSRRRRAMMFRWISALPP